MSTPLRSASCAAWDMMSSRQLSSVWPKPRTLNCFGWPKIRVVSSSLVTAISVGSSSSWASGAGVIYLRILPSNQNAVHAELERILTLYDEQELQASFVVIEPGRHRIRRHAPNQGS